MHDPFGRSRLPADFSRRGRVALVGDVALALVEHRKPSNEGATFLGAAILAWLQHGGSLERDFLRVASPRGSHLTPDVIWSELSVDIIGDERQHAAGDAYSRQDNPEPSP